MQGLKDLEGSELGRQALFSSCLYPGELLKRFCYVCIQKNCLSLLSSYLFK